MGLYMVMGNSGKVAGTWLYSAQDAPRFKKGRFIAMGLAIATAVLTLSNSLILGATNRGDDRKHGKPEEGVSVDVTKLANKNLNFRLIT